MDAFFLKLLNMSVTAGWIILAVTALRFLLKKAPKWVSCALWALVAVRLICPFSLESALSLVPSAEALPQNIISGNTFRVSTGIGTIDKAVGEHLADRYFEGITVPAHNGSRVMTTLGWIWLAGAALMLIYAAVSYLRLRRKVGASIRLRDNIYICDEIATPFILGVISPRIYLPSDLDEARTDYVLAHERAHLSRRDQLWKPLGFILLAVYWFNPLIWLAYALLCRDIELACDERVVREMRLEDKKEYSKALLSCSVPRRMIAACPLAFGELSVKARVKAVLNYRKPAFWLIAAAVVACIVIAVCFLTNPVKPVAKDANVKLTLDDVITLSKKGDKLTWSDFDKYSHIVTGSGLCIHVYEIDPQFSVWVGGTPGEKPMYIRICSGLDDYVDIRTEDAAAFIESRKGNFTQNPPQTPLPDTEGDRLDAAVSAAILKENASDGKHGDFACESHVTLATESDPSTKTTKVYAMVLYQEYEFKGKAFEEYSGSHIPTILTFDMSEGKEYTLLKYWIPRDGDYYAPDIRENFPKSVVNNALDTQKYILAQIQNCYAKVVEYGDIDTTSVLDQLLEDIMDTPKASSNPGDYIKEHPIEYRELLYYGDFTVRYFSAKLQTGQKGLRESIMSLALQELTGGEVPLRTFFAGDTDEPMGSRLTLFESGKFSFMFSLLSSYIGHGTYTVENDRLTLNTDDGKYRLVFEIAGETLIFDAKASTPQSFGTSLKDGMVFE